MRDLNLVGYLAGEDLFLVHSFLIIRFGFCFSFCFILVLYWW